MGSKGRSPWSNFRGSQGTSALTGVEWAWQDEPYSAMHSVATEERRDDR